MGAAPTALPRQIDIFSISTGKFTAGLEKAFETYHFPPTYAPRQAGAGLANVGHPFYSYWVLLGNRLRQDAAAAAQLDPAKAVP
jgi:hypothetical protein